MTFNKRKPKCPYCGYENANDDFEPGEETTIHCGRCGREFNIYPEIEIYFETWKKNHV